MEFRILGPLEVADGSRSLPLDAPKQRALLGLLLLHPNEVVSSERVIDELWGERPPATATKLVQTYVSQLRRLLGAELIATRAPGYALQIDEERLDAARFRRLTAAAGELAADRERESADAFYREALALWRGPPLSDVAFESFARNEVERLGEERLDALSARIDCELALGRHHELVTELETLVGQYPLRERLRAQLMLALYRSGRQADALDVYLNGRRILVDELGLEPGRELQDLEKAILTHDPALEAPSTTKSTSARGIPTSTPTRHRLRRKPALALAAVFSLALGLGLAFTFANGKHASLRLVPNSVGFIDAKSGRITKSFSVGDDPDALAVANHSVWVANYRDATVTRIDQATGHLVTVPVGGHPTGIAAYRSTIWVWTLEALLVPIDPRYNSTGKAVSFASKIAGTGISEVGPQSLGGRVAAGQGFLWVAGPPTTVIRVDAANPRNALPVVPDEGVQGGVTYHDGQTWVGGASEVFPIATDTAIPGTGTNVGVVRDLAFGSGSLWVVSGGPAHVGGVVQALRRLDPHTGLVQATIAVGGDPVAVTAAGGSIWVADRTDGTVERVDPATNRVVESIAVGANPIALAADGNNVWVAVR